MSKFKWIKKRYVPYLIEKTFYFNYKDICLQLLSRKIINHNIIKTASEWIESFGNNKNTGVEEEKRVGLEILLNCGLITNNQITETHSVSKNDKYSDKIIGIINLTQTDEIGGTGDIGIAYNDGTIHYYSVTQWFGKNEKCIFNPSLTKWYKLEKTEEMEKRNKQAYDVAVNYRKEHFGNIPNKQWKRVKNCPGTKQMIEYLSLVASNSWNEMTKETKLQNIKRFIDLDKNQNTNTNGIIYWDKKKKCIKHIFKWSLKINIEDYLDTYSEGIYIYHGTKQNFILRTQAKYNNGIIEGMSSKLSPDKWVIKSASNYLSSVNVVANIDKIFNIDEIRL